MTIIKAEEKHLEEILQLQILAFQKDAIALNNMNIPPLRQNLQDIHNEFAQCIFLIIMDESSRIVGSVRATCVDGVTQIGKLIVHPDYQCRGIGSKLLMEIESCYPNSVYELFTNAKNHGNIKFYETRGYKQIEEKTFPDGVCLLYMRK